MSLYLREAEPSPELIRIINYLVKVYAEVFLLAKVKNKMGHGPRLLLLETMLSRSRCSSEEFEIIRTSLDTNGQFAHHENILVTLLASDEQGEREEAVRILLRIRETGPQFGGKKGQRPFKPQDYMVNPLATSIYNLNINSLENAQTEPPLTRNLSEQQLLKILHDPMLVELPLTSVAVERDVKLTTAVSTLSADSKERDGSSMHKCKEEKAIKTA